MKNKKKVNGIVHRVEPTPEQAKKIGEALILFVRARVRDIMSKQISKPPNCEDGQSLTAKPRE